MATIIIKWKDPAIRDDETELFPEEIGSVQVAMRVGGAPEFTAIGSVAAGVQEFIQTDMPPGKYEFRLTVVDTQSPPAVGASFVILAEVPVPRKAAPGQVTDVTVSIE